MSFGQWPTDGEIGLLQALVDVSARSLVLECERLLASPVSAALVCAWGCRLDVTVEGVPDGHLGANRQVQPGSAA